MKTFRLLWVSLMAAAMLSSCSSSKDVPYLQNVNQLTPEVLRAASRAADPTLMPGDMLFINVSGPDVDAVKPFNKTEYVSSVNSSTLNNHENSIFYYLIDNNGYIDFPMLGKLRLSGMTKTAAEEFIASQIYPRYLTVKPGVEVRMQNFRVFTMGEVGRPGMVQAPNGRMNLLEALSESGDLTIQGRRDNIMIIRTAADGAREVHTVNLNDPNLVVSPYFNLQQNDIIYVEPNASKARSSWSVPPGVSLGLSSVGIAVSIATLVVTLTK